jgi:predicted DCC family thiol-disulfide oxidoreductase YuxK
VQATPPERQPADGRPILFFDGDCALCDGWIDRFMRLDREAVFAVATLQGETARRRLPELRPGEAPKTLVLLDGPETYERSEAALRALHRAGGRGWRALARALMTVPRPLRDLVYDVIARNRYRWFGKREQCRLPRSEAERRRFLP